jgi:hypothetical protein
MNVFPSRIERNGAKNGAYHKLRAVVYSQSNLARDPRVSRQLELLGEGGWSIAAFGTDAPLVHVDSYHDLRELIGFAGSKDARGIMRFVKDRGLAATLGMAIIYGLCRIKPLMGLRDAIERRWTRRKVIVDIRAIDPDLIIANDITALNICAVSKGRARLVFDAHEFSPGQVNRVGTGDSVEELYADAMLRRYLPQCDAMMTVGKGIAKLYQENYGILPMVITNSPKYENLEPLNRGDGLIKLVHHGVASQRRRLEGMIDLVRLLDSRFTLDFFLMHNDERYLERLKHYAAGEPRVRFNEPVPTASLPAVLNHFDIGLRFYEPLTVNMQHGMPNKFFEYVQARIAVAVGPTPEVAEIVNTCGFGIVADDFSPATMAAKLSSLGSDDIVKMKAKAHEHAYELSAQPQMAKLKDMIDVLFQGGPHCDSMI